jgi:hypothetical protein
MKIRIKKLFANHYVVNWGTIKAKLQTIQDHRTSDWMVWVWKDGWIQIARHAVEKKALMRAMRILG